MELPQVLEALLFASGDPVDKKEAAEKLTVSALEMEDAVSVLAVKYAPPSGVLLRQFGTCLQLCSNPEAREQVELFLNPVQKKSFTQASLEVLGIIAYRQPVTRTEIEEIRGVKCDYSVAGLLQKGLIEVTGRKDTVGHPLLFGTTPLFMRHFGLTSLSELPPAQSFAAAAAALEEEQSL